MNDAFMETASSFSAVDILVLVCYFIFILIVGFGSLWRTNRSSAEGYFLAGGSMLWLPVGASLFASNIGSEHFIGLSGSGAYAGIHVGIAAFELNALLMLQVLGWVFLPVYLASGVYTLPEYLQKRFGGIRIKMYIACLSLVIYIFTKISVDLFSGALFIQQALGWSLYPSLLCLLAVTGLYTVTGGLTAVIYTETLQTSIMIIGAMWLCIASFNKIGGYENLKQMYFEAIPNETLYRNDSCGLPQEDSFHLIRDARNSDLPWPGFFFGQNFVALWYWAADQVIVQRALAAKTLSHGQGGTLLAGLFKVTPLFFIVMPGMIARILYPDIVACVDNCEEICGSPVSCSNLAFPLLVMDPDILPTGVHGLLTAVMLSALMSSLTSVSNSSATIFTMDIWRRVRRFPSDREMGRLSREDVRKYELELMIVGRVFIAALIAVSILWVPIIQGNPTGQLFVYIQQVVATLAPPIAGVFLMAILWERVTERGVFYGLVSSLVLSVVRLALQFAYPPPRCGEADDRPPIVVALLINYMYFAIVLLVWTLLSVTAISLLTDPIPREYLYRLTFWTRFSREPRRNIMDAEWDKKEEQNGQVPLSGTGKDDQQNSIMENAGNGEDIEESSADGRTGASGRDAALITRTNREDEPLIDPEPSWCRRTVSWLCGCSPGNHFDTDQQIERRETHQMDKIIQSKRDKIILNIGLVVMIALYVFIYACYG